MGFSSEQLRQLREALEQYSEEMRQHGLSGRQTRDSEKPTPYQILRILDHARRKELWEIKWRGDPTQEKREHNLRWKLYERTLTRAKYKPTGVEAQTPGELIQHIIDSLPPDRVISLPVF